MAAIRVNDELITAADLAIGPDSDHASMIEYWAIHEIEDYGDSPEIEKRLIDMLIQFGNMPEATQLTFAAKLDGVQHKIRIEKV